MSWDELVAVALIGTDRRPVEASVPPGAPAGLGAVLAERGPEDRLLASAAAWTVARRAGARAGVASPVVAADDDPRPLCSAAAGAQLRTMLQGEFRELLPEWLDRAERAGVRPLPELVPALLDVVGPEAAAAAGPLGRWLAEREPRWAFARSVAWAEGGAERRVLLPRLRREDPAAARALLETTFAEETWEDREAFVAALAEGLTDADEPFLEAALGDGRRAVRAAAAELLRRLPRSRFAARAAERSAPLLRVEDGVLHVTLPGAPDAATRRDGFEPGGRRAERLTEYLAATPLATWDVALAALPVADDLEAFVHAGWAQAARHQGDVEWARALELLDVLPREESEARAAAAPDPVLAARDLPGPWGPQLSHAVIEAIRLQRATLGPFPDVRFAGYRLDPGSDVEALRELPGLDLQRLLDVLAFRTAMLRELG